MNRWPEITHNGSPQELNPVSLRVDQHFARPAHSLFSVAARWGPSLQFPVMPKEMNPVNSNACPFTSTTPVNRPSKSILEFLRNLWPNSYQQNFNYMYVLTFKTRNLFLKVLFVCQAKKVPLILFSAHLVDCLQVCLYKCVASLCRPPVS